MSPNPPSNKPSPWPPGKTSCICITLDNLGEAADIHRNIWPLSLPLGTHYSVTTSLPPILTLLAKYSIPCTYFIEAWNFTLYTPQIHSLQSRGHEIGFHAWQHEVWSLLPPETEIQNLEKSVAAAKAAGISYQGFRPPGGQITDCTLKLMREHGFTYLSPAAKRPAVVDGIAILPFQWRTIDAFFYLEAMSGLRVAGGEEARVLEPEVLRERFCGAIDEVVERSGFLNLLFHPFLTVGEERLRVLEDVLKYLKAKGQEIWVATNEEVAEWVLERGVEAFGDDPQWDRAEWKKN